MLRLIRASERTGTIESMDAERDKLITGLFQNIRSNLNNFDAPRRQAAEKLGPVLSTHADINRLNYNAQSAAVTALVADLRAEGLKEPISLLGIGDWVNALAEKNAAFDEQWGSRADEAAEKTPLLRMKEARKAVDEAYRGIVQYVNA